MRAFELAATRSACLRPAQIRGVGESQVSAGPRTTRTRVGWKRVFGSTFSPAWSTFFDSWKSEASEDRRRLRPARNGGAARRDGEDARGPETGSYAAAPTSALPVRDHERDRVDACAASVTRAAISERPAATRVVSRRIRGGRTSFCQARSR